MPVALPVRRAVAARAAALLLLTVAVACSREPAAPSAAAAPPTPGAPGAPATAPAATPAAAPAAPAAGEAAPARPSLTVTATTPRTAPLQRSLPATGTVTAWQEIVVAPEIGGYLVASVQTDVGQTVRKGQTLATLRTDLLQGELAVRRAARAQARAALANAQSVLQRAEPLKATGAISDEELERLRTEELTAQARLQSAEAELSTAQLRLNKARIVAPDAGIVTARSVTVGQVSQPGTEMFRLLRQGRLEWRAEVPEARLGEIRAGQRVRLRTAGGAEIEARVRVVAPTVQAADRSALVYVDLAAGSPLRPGQFVRGEFDLGTAEAMTVPLAALVSQDGMHYVYVLDADNRAQRRRIRIGAIEGDVVEVADGLQPAERVVVQGAGYLRDGDRVALAETAS